MQPATFKLLRWFHFLTLVAHGILPLPSWASGTALPSWLPATMPPVGIHQENPLLEPSEAQALEATLRHHEKLSGERVLLLIAGRPSPHERPTAQTLAHQAALRWGVDTSHQGRSLVLVIQEGPKQRVAVGSYFGIGFTNTLSEEELDQLSDDLSMTYQSHGWRAAIEHGLKRILKHLESPVMSDTQRDEPEPQTRIKAPPASKAGGPNRSPERLGLALGLILVTLSSATVTLILAIRRTLKPKVVFSPQGAQIITPYSEFENHIRGFWRPRRRAPTKSRIVFHGLAGDS